MSEDERSGRSGDGPADELVEISWRGSAPEWVRVQPDWSEHGSEQQLLGRVVELVNDNVPAGSAGDWRSALNLSRLTLPELREFNMLVAEARAEQQAAPTTIQVQSTPHLRAVWYGGQLLELTAEQDWATTVDPGVLGDELTTAIQPPPITDARTTARDRLIRYVGGTSD